MNRYISKSYTTSKNTTDRQHTERGQLYCQLLLVVSLPNYILNANTKNIKQFQGPKSYRYIRVTDTWAGTNYPWRKQEQQDGYPTISSGVVTSSHTCILCWVCFLLPKRAFIAHSTMKNTQIPAIITQDLQTLILCPSLLSESAV